MIAYYGYTISPNQIETGEGFLICRNVPIARIGDMEYLGREIGLTGKDADQVVTVHRSPEEVFSEAALASFEGKPATNDHPPDLIGPDDVKLYEMGHVQNVRRGTGEWADYMVADLHIHDRELIDAIQAGKREISCGYECEYISLSDGTYAQKNIRGNHVAVVERGRAGKRAAILDSDTITISEEVKRPERKQMKKNGLLLKLFGQAVKDKSPEEIEQMALDTADALDTSDAEEKPPTNEAETKETTAEDTAGGTEDISAIVDAAVKKAIAELLKEKEEEKDPIDAAIKNLSSTNAGNSEEAHVVEAEEMDKTCGMDAAAAAGLLKAMRPVVAAIKDEAQRKAVADALIQFVTAKDTTDDAAAILEASQKNAKKAADNKKTFSNDDLQAKYDAMNPHKQKEDK